MKTRFHRFSSSRSFAKLLSIMDCRKSAVISMCAFAVLALETSIAQALPYPTSAPPTSSTNFFGSGPLTVCEFDRRDIPEQINVVISQVGPPLNSGQVMINLLGTAVCGVPTPGESQLKNFAFFEVNVTFGCVTKSGVGLTTKYTEVFGDCPDTQLVVGTFTAIDVPPVGDISALLAECGPPTNQDKPWLDCKQNVGIEPGIPQSTFSKKVCPRDPSTGRTVDGQIFAFEEHETTHGQRPGAIGACYCDGGLANGAVDCGSGNNVEPQTVATSGALTCGFDFQKTGSGADTINASGTPSTINAAIVDSPTCPVADINTATVRVCNDVQPIKKSFKLQTNGGQTVLSFQFSEGACRDSLDLSDSPPTVHIDVVGAFSDGTRFEGSDDAITVQY